MMAKGLSKSIHHNEVLLYRGSFSYILPSLGQKILSVWFQRNQSTVPA